MDVVYIACELITIYKHIMATIFYKQTKESNNNDNVSITKGKL